MQMFSYPSDWIDLANLTFTFGPHEGQTLRETLKYDREYLEFLLERMGNQALLGAVGMTLAECPEATIRQYLTTMQTYAGPQGDPNEDK